jgi:hypothetical protein
VCAVDAAASAAVVETKGIWFKALYTTIGSGSKQPVTKNVLFLSYVGKYASN